MASISSYRGAMNSRYATTTITIKAKMATAIYAGFVPCPLTRMTRASVERRHLVRDALIPRRPIWLYASGDHLTK
jgi:hypothetical protein